MTDEIRFSRQEKKIIDFCRRHGGITTLDAFIHCGCARLSARIFDMRAKGIEFESETVTVKDRDGVPCHVARYTIKEVSA